MSDLYELPNGWEWKPLDEFVKIKGGKRVPKGKKLTEIVTPYPYIRVSDFNDFGSIDLNNIQYVTEDIHNEIKNYIISKDDIYISIAGTIGKTGIVPNELDGANLTENAAKLVFDNSKYDKNYLLYFTNSIPFLEQIGLATKTVAMPKLALTRLKKVEIPLPPLLEQQRIVSKLDKLFEKIDKSIALHQKNMDEADVFMGSVLNDVFGELEEKYEKKPITELSKKIFAGGDKPEEVVEFPTDELNIPIYANGIKNNGLYGYSNVYKVDEECITISARGTIGFTVVRNEKFLPIVRLIVVIPNDKILSTVLKYYLDYKLVENTGSSIPQLTVPTVKKYLIPTPPLQIQQRVVKYLDEISEKIEKIKSVQKEKMDSLKALKASILDKAFKGEL